MFFPYDVTVRILISLIMLLGIKLFTKIFYRFEVKWISPVKEDWKRIRLIAFLNHTSLYEPLFIGILPGSFIFRLSRKLVAPGADKTLNRPIVGKFWRFLNPGIMAISRKRDKTWKKFMEAIDNRSVIVIAPEGRMKRANGLDVNGRPMTIRSGIADILEPLNEGRMLIAYSGGLHHVQIPGQKFPRLFKTLRINLELVEIPEYKAQFPQEGIEWKKAVVADMQKRLEANCPPQES